MTLRELLKSLHAVDEKHLDMDVMASPHSGGYEGISHVSVLYVGHPVIHLAEPEPEQPPDRNTSLRFGCCAGHLTSAAPISPRKNVTLICRKQSVFF